MKPAASPTSDHGIVLFDGTCSFCSATTRFIVRRDRRDHFRLAAIQSEAGQRLIASHGLPRDVSTTILIEGGQAFTRSTAALRIARRLRFPWPLLGILLCIPRPLRDAAYDAFARRRTAWFGTTTACEVPTPELQRRFIDAGT